MTIYSCAPNWEAMLTCIYVARMSGIGHKNLQLMVEPLEQISFLDDYIHVEPDSALAEKVIEAITRKISPGFYASLAYCSAAYEPETLDTIYRVMLLGFAYGPQALDMLQYREVMRFQQISRRVGREICGFREFTRFHSMPGGAYIAHIEPKSRIVTALAPLFSDRMPSEHWMIADDIHREVIVHPKDSPFFLWNPTEEEFTDLLVSEAANDDYTDLWRAFFDSIAIKERANARCQRNLFPEWMRKHAVEFIR